MQFEQAKAAAELSQTEEEFQRELKSYLNPGEISEQELTEAMSQTFPDSDINDIMVTAPEERERRRKVSDDLRDSMRRWLEDNYQSSHRRKMPEKQLLRELSSDTLLNLPHDWQDDEYNRRLDILTTGTAKDKRDLLFEALHEAQKGYTRAKLLSMTDEEIAADFENLHRLHCFVDAARKISEIKELELSTEQQQELRNFEAEFDVSSFIYNRAKLIANPLYSMVRAERLPEVNVVEFMATDVTETEQGAKAVDTLMKETTGLQAFVQPVMENVVKRLLATQYKANEITWYEADGKSREAFYNARNDDYDIPLERLFLDGKLTAVLPDGTAREISVNRLDGGGMTITAKERSAASFMDKKIPEEMKTLSADLEAADPWYIRSSKQFKAVQAELNKFRTEVRELGPRPMKLQQDVMRERLLHLKDACAAYMAYKQQQDGDPNEREEKRIDAVTEIHAFTVRQLRHLDSIPAYNAKFENQQEKEQFRRDQNTYEKNQQSYANQFEDAKEFQRPAPESAVNGKRPTMADCMKKAAAYRNIDCPPSEECGDALERMHRGLQVSLGNLATVAGRNVLAPTEKAKLKRDMATLTVFHLILTERGAKFSGHAGAFEQALKKNPEALISSVENLPKFSECIGEVTPVRVEDFLMNDGARKVGQEIINLGLMQAKAPEQPAPEKSVQKEMQNPFQK